jgi:MoaA/NifB/PqqE/SkfB family radical SAM enzyme
MIEDFVKKHVAVSSLESAKHAMGKDPGVITCTWFIGKRCNYDCSYCASFYHDNYSPHASLKNACNFIDQFEQYATTQNKKIKIAITGGEPFANPNFLKILEYASDKTNVSQLTLVTNGSMPLSVYQKAANYLTAMTISLHLEQPEHITNKTIENVIALNQIQSLFLNVNIMLLPGRLRQVKKIISKFQQNNIRFATRKIEPPFENKDNRIQKGDQEAITQAEETFVLDKIRGKNQNKQDIDRRLREYYSKEELEFLEKSTVQWKNIRLHSQSEFLELTTDELKARGLVLELHTDELKARGLNNWQNWQCYIGIDSLYIQHNGEIYRGNCMLGEKLGDVGTSINWPSRPFTCTSSSCGCNADMMVRKVKNSQYENIIN